MRAFSQPPWDSPLAAMEQNRAKDSSWSRISWNRLLADSMVGTLSAGFRAPRASAFRWFHTFWCSAKDESSAGSGVLQQARRATPPKGGPARGPGGVRGAGVTRRAGPRGAA
ncbi:hypothetical protein GCM10015536_13600 [Streptomyces griseomycini]|nr:hypothetical protein GCM10015536_13600 [Streptomyces griseomycini]